MKKFKITLFALGILLSWLFLLGCSTSRQAPSDRAPLDGQSTAALGKLAYIQAGNLWVKELPSGKATQVTSDGTASYPSWSPTGKWLLFQKKDQLWLTDAGGAIIGQVADKVNSFTWSATVDVYYYATAKEGLVAVGPENRTAKVRTAKMLVKAVPGVVFKSMTVSPDGRNIALQKVSEGSGMSKADGIWKVDTTTGRESRIFKAQPPSGKSLGAVAHLAGWSSDGEVVYLWLGPQSGSITADGVSFNAFNADTGKPLFDDSLVPASLVYRSWFAAGPEKSAALIVGAGRETWRQKELALINTGGEKGVTSLNILNKGNAAAHPAFSPAGDELAFTAGPEVPNDRDISMTAPNRLLQRHIWVVKTTGGSPSQITSDSNYRDERPVWTADGRQLLFARLDGKAKASLWLMDAGGTNPRQVASLLSPLDGFGYFGYVEWDQVFDYWPGPAK